MVLDQVKKIIVDNLGADESAVNEGSKIIDDLGADSLDVVDLMDAISDEFGVEIPENEVENMVTVGDIVKYIEANK